MPRLIDADALVNDLTSDRDQDANRYMYWYQKEERDAKYNFAIDKIDDAPTVDAVEVVRCKDCKYCDETQYGYECNLHSQKESEDYPAFLVDVSLNDFCSYGKKRGDSQ